MFTVIDAVPFALHFSLSGCSKANGQLPAKDEFMNTRILVPEKFTLPLEELTGRVVPVTVFFR